MLKAAEGLGVQNAVAVALVTGAQFTIVLRTCAAHTFLRKRRVFRQHGALDLLCALPDIHQSRPLLFCSRVFISSKYLCASDAWVIFRKNFYMKALIVRHFGNNQLVQSVSDLCIHLVPGMIFQKLEQFAGVFYLPSRVFCTL
jgi:hypothetical protein